MRIPSRDGYPLGAELLRPEGGGARRVVVVNAAMGVPARFYGKFGAALAQAGYTVVLWDYRGVGGSRRGSLRGFAATLDDWIFRDIAGVVDWVRDELGPERLFLVGHSLGGQVAGLLDNASSVDGMIALSAQSAYWRLQGGFQKLAVAFHGWVSLPVLTWLFGYAPWSRIGLGEDLPKRVALGWARWMRHPDYLLGDERLPLERYAAFTAPVLAYSFDDDAWGTARAVDSLMLRTYPNVERRHVVPADVGLRSIGHVGFFRPASRPLWEDAIAWFDRI